MDVYLIAAPGADVAGTVLPLIRDTAWRVRQSLRARRPSAYVVRPDGYWSLPAPGVDVDGLVAHLGATFAPLEGGVAG